VRFLVDAQLPPALARILTERGHDAAHVTDISPAETPDLELWQWAIDNGAVLVTKDEDFADMVTLRKPAPPVVWVRIGNTSRRALLEWFMPLLDEVVQRVEAGETLIELR
jgi:predicted nuclease of predicted toxin-antitoxin system